MIHDDSTHANQYIVIDSTAVHNGSMTDADIRANSGGGRLVSAVYDTTILDIGIVSDTDAVHISTDNSVEPKAAILAAFYISPMSVAVSAKKQPSPIIGDLPLIVLRSAMYNFMDSYSSELACSLPNAKETICLPVHQDVQHLRQRRLAFQPFVLSLSGSNFYFFE